MNPPNPKNIEQLFDEITKGCSIKRFKEWLDSGINVNCVGASYYGSISTLLMYVSESARLSDNHEIVKMMIKYGVDVNQRGYNDATALMSAAKFTGYTSTEKTVKLLIDAGADLNLQGMTR